MKALQYLELGHRPVITEIDKPIPTGSQILLKVTAAGACHSDEFILGTPADSYAFHPLPLTLGHEIAGVVEALGEGAHDVEIGEAVVVYGPWGCGRCYACSQGKENNCEKGIKAPGIFAQGGMAEYVIVDDARHLMPIGNLDPITTVSLTDAGLTPYHSIKSVLPKLAPGSTAVVIGAGGLGHVAIQILKAITSATVIALDLGPQQLEFAREVGADHTFPSDPSAIGSVKELTRGLGADVVFDFVGIQPTADLAAGMIAIEGEIVVVGVAGGAVPVGYLTLPFDVTARVANWGSRSELLEVLELAKTGQIKIHVEEFSMDQAPEAYQKLHDREIKGRAVVVPTR